MRNILIIEDNKLMSERYKEAIELYFEDKINVVQAYDAEEALRKVRNFKIAIIILDINLPDGWDGLDLAAILQKDHPFIPIIVATDKSGADYQAHVQNCIKNIAFLTKGFDIEQLLAEVEYALDLLAHREIEANFLTVKVNNMASAFAADQIVKIEKVKSKKSYEILLYDRQNQKYDRVYFYAPNVEAIFEKFDDPSDFVQCNRSCIINKNQRLNLDRKHSEMTLRTGNLVIDIGNTFRDDVFALFK